MSPESAVFVDIPNVVTGGDRNRRNPRWNVLFAHMLEHGVLDGTGLSYAGAYSPNRLQAWEVSGAAERAFKTAYPRMQTRHNALSGRDIDSWLISDLWKTTVRHEQDSIRHGHLWYPIQMRFVIVSGDGGYLRAFDSMHEAYQQNLERELVVYSWKEKLHPNLEKTANTLFYLDDIPGFVSENPTPAHA